MSRIQNGFVPDGSGTPIGSAGLPNFPGAVLFVDDGPLFGVDPTSFFWNKVENLLGINEDSPDARVHITHDTGGGTQQTHPINEHTGSWGITGNNTETALATNDGNTSGIVSGDSTNPGLQIQFSLTIPTNVGIYTGWSIKFVARKDAAVCPDIKLEVWSNVTWTGAAFTGGNQEINLAGFMTNATLTTSFATYTQTLTSAQVINILNGPGRCTLVLTNSGGAGVNVVIITEVYIEAPGSLNTTPLQKWEATTLSLSNTLNYAADGLGVSTLELLGSPFRIATSALEFDIGTPADDKFWRCTDSEGTGAWETIAASTFPHVLLDSTVHTDTTTGTVARGDLITGQTTPPEWTRLALGAADRFLGSDGTDVAWTAPGALTKTDDTNVTLTLGGTPTTALLRAASLTLGWTGQLALTRGGTGINAASVVDLFNQLDPLTTRGDLLTRDATNSIRLAVGGASTLLKSDGTDPSWGTVDLLSAFIGDTLAASVVRGDIIIGNATPKWSRLAAGASGRVLTSDGTDVSWQPASGGTNALLDGSVHTDTVAQTVSRGSLIYGNTTPAWDELVIGAAGRVLTSDGTDVSWQPPSGGTTHDILSATHTDSVANAVTRGSLIYGNATPKWDELVLSTIGQVLYSNGTDAAWAGQIELRGAFPQLRVGLGSVTDGGIDFETAAGGRQTLQPDFTLASSTQATIPKVTTTLAGLAVTQTFTKAQTFDPDTDVVNVTIAKISADGSNALEMTLDGGLNAYLQSDGTWVAQFLGLWTGGANVILIQPKSAVSTNRTYSIDNTIVSSDFVMTAGAQNIAGAKTFTSAGTTFNQSVLFKVAVVLEDPGAGTNTVTLQAPTTPTTHTLTLPGANADGALSNDGAGALSWASTLTANARVAVNKNSGATVGTRRRINFIEGANITLTVADDAGNEEVDVTITGSGGGADAHGQATVAFGDGAEQATVTVADATIATADRLIATMAYAPSGARDLDELEMDQFEVKPGNIVNGVGFDILVTCLTGYAEGDYLVNYEHN